MEAGDSGSRQSAPNSASNTNHSDYFDYRSRETFDRPYRPNSSTMATAAIISPSTPYHPHHSPYSAPYPPHPNPGPSVPAMISPVDSTRRTSDDSEASQRTSLPSIRDIISGKGSQSGPSGPQSLPSPFSAQPAPPPPRSFAEPPAPREKPPSPRSIHHPSSAYPRSEPLPAFSDVPRSAGTRPGPPALSIYPGQQPHPSTGKPEPAHEAVDHRHSGPDSAHVNGHYPPHHGPSHPPQPASHPHAQPGPQAVSPYANGPPVPLPPGQLPLPPSFPMSPRHHGPPLQSPYSAQRPPMGPEEVEFARNRGTQMGRPYEAWSYAESLARIGSYSRHILSFAETYGKVAQEEQGPPLPGRLPSEAEITDMIGNCDFIRDMLETVRGTVNQTIINQRMREGSRARGFIEDEEANMYNDGMKQGYGATEVKKRRGRAAPPGRCHSCNRIDTPEWRRGPDGARTLCNACGLHYAKLERKRQMEQRGGRPKDDRS